MDILGLVNTVGIDEERLAVHISHLLTSEVHFRPQANRRISLHLHIFAVEQRGVMACVTVLHVTSLEVDESDEHRDEHSLIVVLCQSVVQAAGDDVRLETAVHQRAEHTRHLRHEEGCRHTLAADVAHAEVEQVVDKSIAVEVATHLLRRRHHRIEIHISATGEDVR